jgi:hypothetical protein
MFDNLFSACFGLFDLDVQRRLRICSEISLIRLGVLAIGLDYYIPYNESLTLS